MRRIVIFSFYDKDGVVDSYIDFLLKELKTIASRIIIVVNGKIARNGENIFLKYSDEIVVRQNVGFDAGAYADILLNYLSNDELYNYDELILCNDTFYGPFISMKSIFGTMDKKPVDFWGLNIVKRKLLSFIQSYFLVFRTNILHSGDLLNYFKRNINPYELDIKNIYGTFEPSLFIYLDKKGYDYGTYTNTELFSAYQNAHICIEKYRLPILKKKSFSQDYFDLETQIYTLQYIHKNTKYDIQHILKNAERQYNFSMSVDEVLNYKCKVTKTSGKISKVKYSEEELLALVEGKDFYIYGAGVIARELVQLYFLTEKGLKGFVISDNQTIEDQSLFGLPVKYYHEIPPDVMIIIGVSDKLSAVVEEGIDSSHQVISLWE